MKNDELRQIVADVVRTLAAAIQHLTEATASVDALLKALTERDPSLREAFLQHRTTSDADAVKHQYDPSIQKLLEIEQRLRRTTKV